MNKHRNFNRVDEDNFILVNDNEEICVLSLKLNVAKGSEESGGQVLDGMGVVKNFGLEKERTRYLLDKPSGFKDQDISHVITPIYRIKKIANCVYEDGIITSISEEGDIFKGRVHQKLVYNEKTHETCLNWEYIPCKTRVLNPIKKSNEYFATIARIDRAYFIASHEFLPTDPKTPHIKQERCQFFYWDGRPSTKSWKNPQLECSNPVGKLANLTARKPNP